MLMPPRIDLSITASPEPLRKAVPVSDALLARLAAVSSGSLTTQLYKKGLRQPVLVGLKPLQNPAPRFAGRAFTMRFIPAREDIDNYATLTTTPSADNLQWVGVEQTREGDVLVVDSRSDVSAASIGNLLATRLLKRGVRAVVTDGAFRDGSEIAALPLPAWCAAITATTRLSYHHVADLQVPISCAGVAVYPGDVIHGDGDNITVLPSAWAAEMADLAEAQDALEAYIEQRIRRGEALWGLYPPSDDTRAQYRAWVAAGRPPLEQSSRHASP
jgi:regulator of RNase E activity RraA